MSTLLGPVRQVGYVIRDIERAMAGWLAVGVGPWFYQEDVQPREFRYRGEPSRPPRMSMAIANSGDLQIELIEQIDDTPSLYLDTLRQNGEGAQHLAFWTMESLERIHGRLLVLGYVEGHAGRMSPERGPFAYYLRPNLPGVMIEVSQNTGGKAEYFEQVRLAACAWQGEDPIRR